MLQSSLFFVLMVNLFQINCAVLFFWGLKSARISTVSYLPIQSNNVMRHQFNSTTGLFFSLSAKRKTTGVVCSVHAYISPTWARSSAQERVVAPLTTLAHTNVHPCCLLYVWQQHFPSLFQDQLAVQTTKQDSACSQSFTSWVTNRMPMVDRQTEKEMGCQN